ncbi:unnamed protein product [Cunninghamella blakesleeana]
MNVLPTELLENIFSNFSQRYIITILSTICKRWNNVINQPWLFSTLHIYNKKQLKRVTQLVENKKTINNKPIEFYVQRLIFHYEYSLKKGDINILSVFPNLQHIDGLDDYYTTTYNNKAIYLQLQQPTKFSYFPEDIQWTTKFNNIKSKLKSLGVYFPNGIPSNTMSQKEEQQQLETIYLKNSGQLNINLDPPTVILILPNLSLTNLIELELDFNCRSYYCSSPPEFLIDHYTFENIHQSCPLLESLSIKRFYMHISNEYYRNNKNNIIPNYQLKNINMEGRFCSSDCLSYLATKYLQIESLSLYKYREKGQHSINDENAFINMLFHLPSLKKLTYKKMNSYPDDDFFNWLNLHPYQLTHLKYIRPSAIYESISNTNINNTDKTILLSQQLNYLTHLTSLSLNLDNATDLAFTFLLGKINTIIVSTILEELNIEYSDCCKIKYIYIYDWLDMFPNILASKLIGGEHIVDNNDYIEKGNNEDEDDTSNKLHQLINKRKQQQMYDTTSKVNNNHSIYRLKSLIISCNYIWFKNGFDEFLKKCHQLKILELYKVIFISSLNAINGIQFDLPHLHLELLETHHISYAPINNFKKIKTIKKYIIHESLIDFNRVFEKDAHSDDIDQLFTLKSKIRLYLYQELKMKTFFQARVKKQKRVNETRLWADFPRMD